VRHAQTQAKPFTKGGHFGRGLPLASIGAKLCLKGRRDDREKITRIGRAAGKLGCASAGAELDRRARDVAR
jgi:hypothetical protein